MKKVLFIAYYFPPIAASGSLRAIGLCRYLERYGWRPWVLTTVADSVYPREPVDESLGGRVPPHLVIDRVPDANPVPALLQARHMWRKAVHGVLPVSNPRRCPEHNAAIQAPPPSAWRLAALQEAVCSRLLAFPDHQCFWRRQVIRHFATLPRQAFPDAVFATGSPWTALLVGKALAQKFQVPFVADFRDPWTGNPNQQSLPSPMRRRSQRLERAVCAAAARVILNTEALHAQFLNVYPEFADRCLTLTNGFDHQASAPAAHVCRALPQPSCDVVPGTLFELCHFGTIYGNRYPVALLQAMQELCDAKQLTPGQLRIRFVGHWERRQDACESLAQALENVGLIQRQPAIPHDRCLQQMATANVLLVLQPAYPLQIPAKIYECIATRRPLVVIGGEGATATLVRRYQLGRCCPNQVGAIKELLWRLMHGQEHLEPPLPAAVDCFDYRTLASQLARVLDAVHAESSRRSGSVPLQ